MSNPEIDEYGTKIWRNKKGEVHRLDGPAVILTDGSQEWYENGKNHRLDGPAINRPDGSQEWFVNGKLHRLNGPAMIWADGTKEWWVNDTYITEEVNEWMKQMNISYPFNDEEKVLFAVRFS